MSSHSVFRKCDDTWLLQANVCIVMTRTVKVTHGNDAAVTMCTDQPGWTIRYNPPMSEDKNTANTWGRCVYKAVQYKGQVIK